MSGPLGEELRGTVCDTICLGVVLSQKRRLELLQGSGFMGFEFFGETLLLGR